MRLIFLLIAALFISSALTLKVLRGDQVPKDYPIGRITQMDFTSDGRIFFEANSHLLGFMDAKTGTITTLFMLEEDEKIISYMGSEGIVISKGKEVNIFSPIQDKYVKLQYSDYLKTQTFTNIIAFKRYFMFDYILTD